MCTFISIKATTSFRNIGFLPTVQFKDYQIALYKKGPGKWTLKQAKDEVIRLDQLRKAGEDPRLLKSESKRELIKQATKPSLIKASEGFLERSKNKPCTVKDYRYMPYCFSANFYFLGMESKSEFGMLFYGDLFVD